MSAITKKGSNIICSGVLLALLVTVFGSSTLAATINLRVETDKARYRIGDTVQWKVYAWASSGDNFGVSFLSIHLDDDTADMLNPPGLNGEEFLGTAYGTDEKFQIIGSGSVSNESPDLREISVAQLPWDMVPNIGNDGWDDHVLAQGGYVVSAVGEHTLTPSFYGTGAHYWVDSVGTSVLPFETRNVVQAEFSVVLKADINLDYYVNFIDYAILAARWERKDCDSTQACDGADLSGDGAVTFTDVLFFAGQWLECTDPDQPYCGGPLSADINLDERVSLFDYAIVAAAWMRDDCDTTLACDRADIDGDGAVMFGDVSIVAGQWLACSNRNLNYCSQLLP